MLVYNPSPGEVEIGKSPGSLASQPGLISRLQINERPCEERLLRFPLPLPTCMSKHTHRQVHLHKHTQTQRYSYTFTHTHIHTHAHKRGAKWKENRSKPRNMMSKEGSLSTSHLSEEKVFVSRAISKTITGPV